MWHKNHKVDSMKDCKITTRRQDTYSSSKTHTVAATTTCVTMHFSFLLHFARYKHHFLDQELISHHYSSCCCCCCCCCCCSCLDDLFKKPKAPSFQIGSGWIWQDSDFKYNVIILRSRSWRHLTQKSADAQWVTVRLSAHTSVRHLCSNVCQFLTSSSSTFVLVTIFLSRKHTLRRGHRRHPPCRWWRRGKDGEAARQRPVRRRRHCRRQWSVPGSWCGGPDRRCRGRVTRYRRRSEPAPVHGLSGRTAPPSSLSTSHHTELTSKLNDIALHGTPSQSYGMSLTTWDHTVNTPHLKS